MFDRHGARSARHEEDTITPKSYKRRDFLKKSTLGALGGAVLLNQGGCAAEQTPTSCDSGRSIKIERIETTKVVVRMKPGTVNSENFGPNTDERLLTFDSLPKFIIRAHTDSGIVGLGETGHYQSSEPWFAEAFSENIRFLTGRNLLELNPGAPGLGLPYPEAATGSEVQIT